MIKIICDHDDESMCERCRDEERWVAAHININLNGAWTKRRVAEVLQAFEKATPDVQADLICRALLGEKVFK